MKQPYLYGTFAIRECAVGTPDGGEATHWHVENRDGEGFACHTEHDAQVYAFGMTVMSLLVDHYPQAYENIVRVIRDCVPLNDKHTLKLSSNGREYVWD